MLTARHAALRRLVDSHSHARGIFTKRLGAAAARAALAPLAVAPVVLPGTSEVSGDDTGERYAVGLSAREIDSAFAAVAAARGLIDDGGGGNGGGSGVGGGGGADGDGDGDGEGGTGGGGSADSDGGDGRGVWGLWGLLCTQLPGSQAAEALGEVAALCGHALFRRVAPMGPAASAAAALRMLLDHSSVAAEVGLGLGLELGLG